MDHERSDTKAIKRRFYVKIVGFGSIIFSAIIFVLSVLLRVSVRRRNIGYNNDPVAAAHLIISLVTACMSVYQIAISVLLLLLAYEIKKDEYYLSLWYISHLSILPMYWCLYGFELYVGVTQQKYILVGVASVLILVYQGTFTFFIVVIDKVMNDKISVKTCPGER